MTDMPVVSDQEVCFYRPHPEPWNERLTLPHDWQNAPSSVAVNYNDDHIELCRYCGGRKP